ncbi:MAG: TRAP transporter fused permease subunit [Armatimonadota bacterium]|nr:TRAP transporter fused permease subunit [Armatimonadota bacterium]MDR5697178.1 TRAP transporter fused permease subunit [Armatimonadota bacterium]
MAEHIRRSGVPQPETTEEVERLLIEADPEFGYRRLVGPFAAAVGVVAVAMSVFHVYTAGWGTLLALKQRAVHVAFAFTLVFLLYPLRRRYAAQRFFGPVDVAFAAAGVFAVGYLLYHHDRLMLSAGQLTRNDLLVGALGILLVLEGGRRVMGVLPFIAAALLVYPFIGEYIPGAFAVRRFPLDRVIEHMWYTTEGVFSIPIGVSATFVFMFVLLGAFLERTGLGQMFVEVAMGIAGWMHGGPAKVSVFSSALLGTVSGSSVANVVADGVFNIPLMKRLGYHPRFAAAAEAATSVGGQIMPPVMGAAAFIMAEFVGVPYLTIIQAAIVPALLYFVSLFFMIHFEARRLDLRGLRRDELPNVWRTIARKWYLAVPLAVMVGYLLQGFSPMRASFLAIVLAAYVHLVTCLLEATDQESRSRGLVGVFGAAVLVVGTVALWYLYTRGVGSVLPPGHVAVALALVGFVAFMAYPVHHRYVTDIWQTLEYGARNALGVAMACAVVGIIIGIVTLTGIGNAFVALTVTLGQQNLFLTLVFVMIACTIVGSGIPTTATYIILAALAVPAVEQLLPATGPEIFPGVTVTKIAAHMFIFYYGVIADLTPPDALAAYAAAGIARTPPFPVSLEATRHALAAIVVPFTFIYSPQILLMSGTLHEQLQAVATAILGIVILAAGVSGYFFWHAHIVERILLVGAAVILIFHHPLADLAGIAVAVLVAVAQILRRREVQTSRAPASPPSPPRGESSLTGAGRRWVWSEDRGWVERD